MTQRARRFRPTARPTATTTDPRFRPAEEAAGLALHRAVQSVDEPGAAPSGEFYSDATGTAALASSGVDSTQTAERATPVWRMLIVGQSDASSRGSDDPDPDDGDAPPTSERPVYFTRPSRSSRTARTAMVRQFQPISRTPRFARSAGALRRDRPRRRTARPRARHVPGIRTAGRDHQCDHGTRPIATLRRTQIRPSSR